MSAPPIAIVNLPGDALWRAAPIVPCPRVLKRTAWHVVHHDEQLVIFKLTKVN